MFLIDRDETYAIIIWTISFYKNTSQLGASKKVNFVKKFLVFFFYTIKAVFSFSLLTVFDNTVSLRQVDYLLTCKWCV